MFDKKESVYTSWPLLLSITVLLANDHFWKYSYPGIVTGKLSDFAGIFLVVLLLRAKFPNQVRIISIGVMVCFLYWKSHFSQPLITAVNQYVHFQIARTVDYTDLIAFCMIPVAHYVNDNINRFQLKFNQLKILKIPIAVMTIFTIMGTSVIRPYNSYSIRKEIEDQQIDRTIALSLIHNVAENHQLQCIECDPIENEGVFEGNATKIKYSFLANNRGIEFEVAGPSLGLIFTGDGPEIVEDIKWQLKDAFGREFKDMEFIIKLPEQRACDTRCD